jgi:hypothetical protein
MSLPLSRSDFGQKVLTLAAQSKRGRISGGESRRTCKTELEPAPSPSARPTLYKEPVATGSPH